MPEDWIQATGRRKTSIARVMLKKGSGSIDINGRTPEEYFPTKNDIAIMNFNDGKRAGFNIALGYLYDLQNQELEEEFIKLCETPL